MMLVSGAAKESEMKRRRRTLWGNGCVFRRYRAISSKRDGARRQHFGGYKHPGGAVAGKLLTKWAGAESKASGWSRMLLFSTGEMGLIAMSSVRASTELNLLLGEF